MARDLLRFLTCGSVDDGKSTLIGRILLDCGVVPDDQLAALERDSRRFGTTGDALDVALLLDGLDAERQQGITIDVAYRYFSSANRAFIVADTPGHAQFTRNMATGASNCELAVILVDARKGVLAQTRRHSFICALMGIRHVAVAINKMDLVAFDQAVFDRISAEYQKFAAALGFQSVTLLPVAARDGDNVVHRSTRAAWYQGPTLLEYLDHVDVRQDAATRPFRFPVQYVLHPDPDFRGLSGTIASGAVAVGDGIVVAASGKATTVKRIVTFDGDLLQAEAGQAVTLVLADEVDIIRGDLLAPPRDRPEVADQFAAHVVWMSDQPMLPGRSYLLMCGTRLVPARVTLLKHRIDINDLSERSARTLELNDIGVCNIATDQPLVFDAYAANHCTGAFILIDRTTHATAGAGMIDFGLRRANNIHPQSHSIGKAERAAALGQKPQILWFTGLSGSGKSTIADLVEKDLHRRGIHSVLLDGDNMRSGLNRDLGFSDADRVENIRRVGEVARLMLDAGLVVICCFISPFAAEREMVRDLVPAGEFTEIFVDTALEECIRRDPKGLYAKALTGKIPNFTGIGSPYEVPVQPDLRIAGAMEVAVAVDAVVAWVMARQG